MEAKFWKNEPRYVSPGDVVVAKHKKFKSSPQVRRTDAAKAKREKATKAFHLASYRERVASGEEIEFRHENWKEMRKVVGNTLRGSGASEKSLFRYENCGAECTVEYSKELDRHRLRASYCHCRHCRPCAKAKAGLIAQNLRTRIECKAEKSGDRYRFITLTLKHSDQPLVKQIRRLIKCFSRLRNTPFWKKSQRGGCSMIEVKRSARGEWHPHLHIIGEGDFLRQETLSKEWLKVTGDSFRVDVRAINSGKDAVHYVSKYVCKGVDDSVWNDTSAAQEWVTATKGLRIGATYGTWRGFRLLDHDPATEAKDWSPVCTINTLQKAAWAGELWACKLLPLLWDTLQYDPSRKKHKNVLDKMIE